MIEILVAITLCCLIAAFLFPVFQKGRDAALSTKCANNLRAYGVGILTLVADRGSLPHYVADPEVKADFKAWLVPKYLSEIPRCPRVDERAKKDGRGCYYAGNLALAQYYPSLKGIPVPAPRVVLASECYLSAYFYHWSHLNTTMWGTTGTSDPQEMEQKEGSYCTPQYHGDRKNRGLYLMFLDGHLELVRPGETGWGYPPTLGSATNRDGYFYFINQFEAMSRGLYK